VSGLTCGNFDPMATVLIIGASGGIGLAAVNAALKAGYSVRALSRSASAIRFHDPKLEKLDGDALDRDTIERALLGVDAVIQTLGVSLAPQLIFSGTHLFSAATRVLVRAMQASGVTRLICVTGFGAGDSRGPRRNSLQRGILPVRRAHLRRQGRAGAHRP
jgi:putative NADH-flavin reductase